jgi:small subunit ribosomal protein S6
MPINLYECMLMLDSGKVAGDLEGFKTQLHAIFDKHKAEIMASRPWDERRLAYPVKKQKKAMFYLAYIQVDSQALVHIEHDITLNESVLRHLVMRILPKWKARKLSLF